MTAVSQIAIRRARESDVRLIVAMLADDPLGNARERLQDPLPQCYFEAFDRLDRDPNIQLVVAQDGRGRRGRLSAALHPGWAQLARRLARPD
jgi:hypothetical protein